MHVSQNTDLGACRCALTKYSTCGVWTFQTCQSLDTSEVLLVKTSFSFIGEPEKEMEWYFIPPQFVRALSWSVILSPLGLTLPSSPGPPISSLFFLLCKYYSDQLAACETLTQRPQPAALPHSGGHPRSANSIWSSLPSSHSAESESVSGGVSEDHYHILSMSSFMALVYSRTGAAHGLWLTH